MIIIAVLIGMFVKYMWEWRRNNESRSDRLHACMSAAVGNKKLDDVGREECTVVPTGRWTTTIYCPFLM